MIFYVPVSGFFATSFDRVLTTCNRRTTKIAFFPRTRHIPRKRKKNYTLSPSNLGRKYERPTHQHAQV